MRIEFEGSAQDVLREMQMFLGASQVTISGSPPTLPHTIPQTTETAAEPEKPKATRSKKSEAPAASAEGNQSAPAAGEPEKPPVDSSATSATTTPSREEIQKKCMAYGQPTKGGPEALRQLFIEQGSANGKWSEVPDANLAALNARLDDLLA